MLVSIPNDTYLLSFMYAPITIFPRNSNAGYKCSNPSRAIYYTDGLWCLEDDPVVAIDGAEEEGGFWQ